MSKEIYRSVLSAYEIEKNLLKMESFGSGLINTTWKISTTEGEYILQKINHAIFKRPKDIAHNIHLIDSYIRRKYPTYRFIGPVSAKDGETVVYEKGLGYFRLFPFVSGSHSLEIVRTPHQAYEAAAQFGRFTRLLSGFDGRDFIWYHKSFYWIIAASLIESLSRCNFFSRVRESNFSK